MSGLILDQAVCKGYQRMTKFVTSRKKVKTDGYELYVGISRMSQLPPGDKVSLICLNQLLYIY